MGHALVGRLVNKVTNFSQLQSSVQGGKTQAYRSYVEFFQRSNGGCSEDKVLPYLSNGPLGNHCAKRWKLQAEKQQKLLK